MRGVTLSESEALAPTFTCDEQTRWSGRYASSLRAYCKNPKKSPCPVVLFGGEPGEGPQSYVVLAGNSGITWRLNDAEFLAVVAQCYPRYYDDYKSLVTSGAS